MTDDEFDAFLGRAVEELERKQDVLGSAYGVGTYASFWFDQESASLEFRDADGKPHLNARIVPLGSHSGKSDTWMWAWGNESILPTLRVLAEPLKELATETGQSVLRERTLNVTPEMPWELTALSVQHLGALGAYRARGRDSDLYLAIMDVKRIAIS